MGWFWGTRESWHCYLTVHLNCDPSTRVHDIEDTEFIPKAGETVDDAPDYIINEYLRMAKIKNAHPVQILSFRYK